MISIIFDDPLETASQFSFRCLTFDVSTFFFFLTSLIYFSFLPSGRVAFPKAEKLEYYTYVYKPQLREHNYVCLAKSIFGFYKNYNRK